MNDWLSWAVRRPGPANKMYVTPNRRLGLVCHSVEGWLAGAFGELDKPERQASWHFTNALDGTLYQHYPLTASCWASGNAEANGRYIAVESEGTVGSGPLNAAQVATMVRLATELGFTERGGNLWEHSEVATRWTPNAGPTACPSNRYDGVFAALAQEEDMAADPRVDQIIAALGGQEEIDKWNGAYSSLLPGYKLEQSKLAEHIASFHGGGGGKVLPHGHKAVVTTVTSGEVVQ